MNYIVNMVYADEKVINLVVPREDIEEFFEDLKRGKMYMNDEKQIGFWTDVHNLRYVTVVEKYEEEKKDDQQ